MLTNSASIQTLLTQFYSRYPLGSVASELLTIHENTFVVRAVIQVGGMTLATAMAAAIDIEQAEDRAKVRALSALGMGSFAGSIASTNLAYPLPGAKSFDSVDSPGSSSITPQSRTQTSFTERPSDQVIPDAASSSSQPARTAESWREKGSPQPDIDRSTLDRTAPESLEQSSKSHSTGFLTESQLEPDFGVSQSATQELDFSYRSEPAPETEPSPPEPSPEVNPKSSQSTSSKGKSTKRKLESSEATLSVPSVGEHTHQAMVDRSDVNAKIGIEMKRLGWTVEQGRNHLKRTYGRRSRQELEDSELLDFLKYLESQPMATNSPF